MAQRQIVGGGFQDALGNPLNSGYLTLHLSTDVQIIDIDPPADIQVGAGRIVRVNLDLNGNVSGTVLLWPTDLMRPSGAVYIVTGYTVEGQVVWGPSSQNVLSGGSPFDLTNWEPGD